MKHNEFIVSSGSKYVGRLCPVTKQQILPDSQVVICPQSDTALSDLVFKEQTQCPLCQAQVVLTKSAPAVVQQPLPQSYRSGGSPVAMASVAAIVASVLTLVVVFAILLATNVIPLTGGETSGSNVPGAISSGQSSTPPAVAASAFGLVPTTAPPAVERTEARTPIPPPLPPTPTLAQTEPTAAIVSSNLAYLATAQASSVLAPEQTISLGLVSFEPSNVLDRNPASSWVEGVSGPGYGERLVLTFPRPITVSRMGLTVGYDRDEQIFFANHRVRSARFEFDNGASIETEFEDRRGTQLVDFPPTRTQTIAIVILDVYPGSLYDDTPIAEVEIWGTEQ